MSNASGAGEPFVFEIPVMRARRKIALAYITFCLLIAFIIPLKVGFSRFHHGLETHPGLWVVYFMFAAAIAFFLRLAFPPRSTRPRLEIKCDNIRYIPGKIERLTGEQAGEVRSQRNHAKLS